MVPAAVVPAVRARIKPGALIGLVQWRRTPAGWSPMLVEGLYAGYDNTHWLLLNGGHPFRFRRDRWELAAA